MKKTNNKGFSLVELIIVIAIMAILIGVLAPQYIKYVERSRVSSDKDMIDSVTKAVQTATTDDDYYDQLSINDKVEISKANGIVPDTGALTSAVQEFYGSNYANNKFKSKAFASTTITIQVVQNTVGTSSTLQVDVIDSNGGSYNPASYK